MLLCPVLFHFSTISLQALSDWCMNPNPFLEEQLVSNEMVSRDVAAYYLRCDPSRTTPFTRYLTRAQQTAELVLELLSKVTRIADEFYERKMVNGTMQWLVY